MHSPVLRLAFTAFICFGSSSLAWHNAKYEHVAIFSVDGLHGSDIGKYVALRPKSTIASMLETGYEYTDAYTSDPSDSFPGTMNQYTGAHPRTTGVWYDDTYDRTFFTPYSMNKTHCAGKPGAEVVYDESIDYNSTELFSGGIDPSNLPQTIINDKCTEVYPHQRLRVNTIFEIVEAAGGTTAYTDKHPAYDILRGPSGNGLSVGYFPEIASIENTVEATIAYDKLHVAAFKDFIAGTEPAHSEIQGQGLKNSTPALFGGNFQAVSVAQKTHGYEDKTLAFTPELLKALDFVDDSLGQIVAALKQKSIFDKTLIIVASKHGQAPIDPSLFREVDPALIEPATGAKVAFVTTDDIALIFLDDQKDLDKAVAGLRQHSTELAIDELIFGMRLTALGYGDPSTDPAVPDIIVRPKLGVIYTTSKAKIAEHGGLSDDDRHVACFVSGAGFNQGKKVMSEKTSTRQVAPTVLKVLGLADKLLEGAAKEGTKVLEGF